MRNIKIPLFHIKIRHVLHTDKKNRIKPQILKSISVPLCPIQKLHPPDALKLAQNATFPLYSKKSVKFCKLTEKPNLKVQRGLKSIVKEINYTMKVF